MTDTDEIGLDLAVILIELVHVDNKVAYHRKPRQGSDFDRLFKTRDWSNTGKTIYAIDIHTIRAADTFTA